MHRIAVAYLRDERVKRVCVGDDCQRTSTKADQIPLIVCRFMRNSCVAATATASSMNDPYRRVCDARLLLGLNRLRDANCSFFCCFSLCLSSLQLAHGHFNDHNFSTRRSPIDPSMTMRLRAQPSTIVETHDFKIPDDIVAVSLSYVSRCRMNFAKYF